MKNGEKMTDVLYASTYWKAYIHLMVGYSDYGIFSSASTSKPYMSILSDPV